MTRPTTAATPASIPRIDPSATLNQILREHPVAVAVLNAFGIDACCGGARTLADAAGEDGADLAALLAALERGAHETEARR
jgi:regulator of cell morphogenesis and NO signaling